eukprot:TRINITY_DN20008_c0_g1_i1.p1 TRINITY_DN20008_c0_g1~~TRINITY_DN20008_c0_g1_i1.p1  ORF type:complete len:315 (+),score=25.40 TRINITY_DN20008_c0_g1_i1:64-945(+)
MDKSVFVHTESSSFIVIGDSGVVASNSSDVDTNTLHKLVNVMEISGIQNKHAFVLGQGDNFYPDGVSDVNSVRFSESFLDVFNTPYLQSVYFFQTLGNHDWSGNTSAQIAFTQSPLNNPPQWCMPDYNYTTVHHFPNDVSVRVIALDTQSMLHYCNHGCQNDTQAFCENPTIDKDCSLPQNQHHPKFKEQLSWLKDLLCSSEEDWVIVMGHHFIASAGAGRLPNTYEVAADWGYSTMRLHLAPILNECRGADAYFQGHDHITQALQTKEGMGVFWVRKCWQKQRPRRRRAGGN